jgi:hypothetical protein
MDALKREHKKSKNTSGSSRHWSIKTKSRKNEANSACGKKLSRFGRRFFNTFMLSEIGAENNLKRR